MAVYYVRADGLGSDSNDGLTFDTAWATLGYADSRVTSGHELRICSDEDNKFTPSAQVYAALGSTWQGADLVVGSPLPRGSFAFVEGGASYGIVCSRYVALYNLDIHTTFPGFSSCCVVMGSGAYACTVAHCRIHSTQGKGVWTLNRSSYATPNAFIDCEFYGNYSGVEMECSTTARDAGTIIVACIFRENTYGFRCVGTYPLVSSTTITDSVFRGNQVGLYMEGGALDAKNSIFVGNTSHGVHFARSGAGEYSVMMNCIFADNGGYGVLYYASTIPARPFFACCFWGNTSGASNQPIFGALLYANPKFTDAPNGDYSLQSDSPCIGAGLGYNP